MTLEEIIMELRKHENHVAYVRTHNAPYPGHMFNTERDVVTCGKLADMIQSAAYLQSQRT